MPSPPKFAASLVLCALALCTGAAHAVLSGEISALEVTGRVDLDGFGAQPPVSDKIDNEFAPFTRSIVSVADALPGTFSYAASSDIGNLALRVAGSLTNSTAGQLGDGEVAILRTTAQALDIVTVHSTSAGNFPATMELVITGSVIPSAQAGFIAANSLLQFGLLSQPNGTDSGRYVGGAIDDTLSVTRIVNFSAPDSDVQMDVNAFVGVFATGVLPGETIFANLSNTALLRLVLPPELTVVGSVSGTYGVPIPIPEPQTYALMLVGLGLMVLVVNRRRRLRGEADPTY